MIHILIKVGMIKLNKLYLILYTYYNIKEILLFFCYYYSEYYEDNKKKFKIFNTENAFNTLKYI